MLIYDQKKQELLQLFQRAIAFAQDRRDKESEKFLKESMQHLSDGKLFVVVCGEFKKGKSSFINALLDEIDLCPVDIDVTTSIVSTIAYGDAEKLSVFIGEPGQQATEKVLKDRDEIADYVTEQRNPHNARQARMLSIQLPNKQLASGMVIADTPGIGGINSEHTDVTSTFMFNADVILYVSDAMEPLSSIELQFVEKYTHHCPNVLFILTKIDQNADFPIVVEDNRRKLAQTLGRPENEITIISVSSLAKRDYLESQDEEDLKESNFTTLETRLWKDLNEGQGRILLIKAGTSLNRTLAELRFPIETELDACKEQDLERLQQMEREVQSKQQRLQALLENNAQWHTQLRDGLEDVQYKVSEDFSERFVQIRHYVNTYLDDKHLRQHPEEIVTHLQGDINALLADLQKRIEEESGILQQAVEHTTGLHLNPYREFSLTVTGHVPEPLMRDRSGLWQRSLDVARGTTTSGVAGATVAGAIGGVIFGAIGIFGGPAAILPMAYLGMTIGGMVGQVAGMATGMRRTIRQLGKQERAVLAHYLMNFVAEQEMIQARLLKNTFKDLERHIRDEFTGQLTREKKSVEEALFALQSRRKLSQNQSMARIAPLSLFLQRLDTMRQNLENILTSVLSNETKPDESELESEPLDGVDEDWADE